MVPGTDDDERADGFLPVLDDVARRRCIRNGPAPRVPLAGTWDSGGCLHTPKINRRSASRHTGDKGAPGDCLILGTFPSWRQSGVAPPKAAPGLPRAEFISRWTTDFVKIVRRTPGQVAYGRLIVDSIETAKLARDLQFEQPDFDAMVLGGFPSAAELETAVTWANTDQTHAAAVQQLFAPDFRTILVAPRDVAAPRDLAEDISLSTRLQ